MSIQLETGRPADCTGRLEKEVQTYDLLDRLGINYLRVDHEAAATMDDLDEAERTLGCGICKNLFLCNRQKTDFYLLTMPARKPFKTKELSGQLGISRLSFCDEALLLELLNLTPGSVSVMGLAHDTACRVRLIMDRDVAGAAEFACHPMINTSSIKMNTADLMEKFLPAVNHTPTLVTLTGES